jgi:surface protein
MTVTYSNITYTLQSGTPHTAWVTGNTLNQLQNATNVIIPETITSGPHTYTVTFIDSNAFKNSSKLASISIPDSIIRVLFSAFENCSQLTAVSIGNTCNSILGSAFNNCPQLSTVTIGAGLTDIGSYAFANCQSLTSMYFLGDKPSNQIAVVDNTDNVKIYYAASRSSWSSTFINRPAYPIPTINSVSSSGASISASSALSSVYVYTSADSGVTWTTNSVTMSGGSGTFNSSLSEGTLVSTIANFYDATTYADYSKTVLKSFSFQFDCTNTVDSSIISTYLPIDNTNNSITIANINVTSNANTYTVTIYYSYDIPISPDGLNFKVTTEVFDYYNNTSNASGVSNLQILDLNTIPLAPNGDLFANLSTLTSFNSGAATPYLYENTNFNGMFTYCTALQSVIFDSNFNTLNVVSMEYMFNDCHSLESIVFGSNFTTSNVANMGNMFNNCYLLQALDLSTFDTSNVTNMTAMFGGCFALSSIDLTSFNTVNVTNMLYMFAMTDVNGDALGSNLTTITFGPNFTTVKVENMGYMFSNANSLTSLITVYSPGNSVTGIENWDTSKVTNMNGMFEYTSSLTDVGNLYDNWVVTDVIANNNYNGFSTNSALSSMSIPNFTPTPNPGTTPSSNVCFPAKTPIMTNQGPINIEDINPKIHTIRNKKIVAITKTVAHDKKLVRIAKHALGHLYPEKTTLISQNHKVFYQGKMIKAKHLVDDCNVNLVPYNGQVLYNVLLEEHEKMQVNNLIVETLHPEHKVAKLYRFLKNVDAAHHAKFIAAFNKKDLEHRSHFHF